MQAPVIFSDDQAEAFDRVAAELYAHGIDLTEGALTPMAEGKPSVLAVVGKAGSGKTLLLANLTKALIAAGGKFLPSTSDLRDECRVQRKAAHASYTPTTMGEAVCEVCEGIGQVETRQEWYGAAPPGKPARQMLRHYWAPCGRCARGRRLADNRQRGASDVPARPQRQRGAA